jgi:predicted aspartyl protease
MIRLKYFSVFIALSVCAVALQACASPKPEVEKLDLAMRPAKANPIAFPSFWEAMQNLDLAFLNRDQLDNDQRTFAGALRLIEDRDMTGAELKLKELCLYSQDPAVKKHSAKLLQSVLFQQSKWSELLKLHQYPDLGELEDEVLADAYSKAPAETYSFPEKPVELPMKLSNTGSPMIPIIINGQQKEFLLDTGAGVTVVASDAAAQLNVQPAGGRKEETQTATSKKVSSQPAVISELRIGAIRIQNHPALILPKEDLEFKVLGFLRILKIDGIIGWNAIQNMDVELDYGNHQAILRRPVRNEDSPHNFFWIGYPVVNARSENGQILRFGLDTGANRSSIRENIFRKISVPAVKTQKLKTGSAGGWETADSKVLPTLGLDLCGYRLHFKDIATHSTQLATFIQLDGILGSDIGEKAKLRLDYYNGRFVFTR